MNKPDLSQPTRQSIKGLAIIFLQSIRQAISAFWALIAVVVLQRNIFQDMDKIVFGLILIFILLIAHTILYYLNFYFYVNENEFILKKGYLRKKVLTIPFERIQSINTKQNIIQQALDVVALEIDTAGTAGKELKIHALEEPFAKALSEILSQKKETVSLDEEAAQTEQKHGEKKLVLKLQPKDLLRIGISENHLQTGLIILAFGYQIFHQVQEIFEDKANEYSNEFLSFLSASSLALIIFLVIFFAIVAILFSLFRTLIKYYDFKLTKTDNSYLVEAGLLNKRNVVLPHNKIQQLNWEINPLKKLFGIYKLVFKQAVSMQTNKIKVVDAPGCLSRHLELLKSDLFGEDQLTDSHKFFSNFHYFRVNWGFSGWLPVILATAFLYDQWIFWLSAFVWLLITCGYNYLVLKKRYFQINNKQVRVSSGAVSQKWQQMELYKIQSVEFKQSIFHKPRGLASLQLMNASGSITIPFIDESLAKQIYDYLLYHTETSHKAWM